MADPLFPPGPTPATDFSTDYGEKDGFVAKFDPDGSLIWAFRIGGLNNDAVTSICLDSAGSIYITGYVISDTAEFAGTTPATPASSIINSGPVNVFLAKYSSGGALQWVKHSNGARETKGSSICLNSSGIFVTGTFTDEITFDTIRLPGDVLNKNVFLAKYAYDGNIQWAERLYSEEALISTGLSCDNSRLFMAGSMEGTALTLENARDNLIDTVSYGVAENHDIFIICFTNDGIPTWTRRIESTGEVHSGSLVIDNENLYLTGSYENSINFPSYSGNPVLNTGGSDAFISSMSKLHGGTNWVYNLSDDAGMDQVGVDIERDPAGKLYVTGYFTGRIMGGTEIQDSRGEEDFFLACLTSQGTLQWINAGGGLKSDVGRSVSVSNPGDIYMAGTLFNSVTDSSIILQGGGNENIFLTKIESSCKYPYGGYLQASDQMICETGAVQLALTDYFGDLEWQISPPGLDDWSLLTGDSNDTITIIADSTADYRVLLNTDTCGSAVSTIVNITVDSPPSISLPLGIETCGREITLTSVTDASDGLWELVSGPGEAQIQELSSFSQVRVTVESHGTYVFQFTAFNLACSLTASTTVEFKEIPVVDAGGENRVCHGEGAQLFVEAEGSYLWSPGQFLNDSTLQDPVALVDTSTSFHVSVRGVNGCVGSDEILVHVFQMPVADAGTDQQVIENFEARMSASLSTVETGRWEVEQGTGRFVDLVDPGSMVYELGTGENIFSWHVSNGVCPESADQVSITVLQMIVPTVITPNGDGLNDFFIINGIEQFEESELIVSNRWGEVVYEEKPYTNSWNGLDRNGRELPEETYYIVLKISDNDIRKGYVVILR
jgi:gliding motility-associated-like protein